MFFPALQYVCNLAAEGLVNAVNTETYVMNDLNAVETVDCLKPNKTSSECGVIHMSVNLGDKSPFPTYSGNFTLGYKVTLNAGDGNSETLQVLNVSEAHHGVQDMTVSRVQASSHNPRCCATLECTRADSNTVTKWASFYSHHLSSSLLTLGHSEGHLEALVESRLVRYPAQHGD